MTEKTAAVDMINRKRAIALLSDDTVIPITHWFGPDGKASAPDDALTCVAGADGCGWHSIDLAAFEDAQPN